jgi:hypothetical protein
MYYLFFCWFAQEKTAVCDKYDLHKLNFDWQQILSVMHRTQMAFSWMVVPYNSIISLSIWLSYIRTTDRAADGTKHRR